MVSVQAAAGSIINQAMRWFLEDMTVDLSDPNGLLEEYWAESMFWEYTEMEWDNGPFGKDIKGGEMERSAIPKPAFYIKRGEMERDLALSTKRRERRERKKKTSRKAEASEWDIEAAWVEFINDNGPYELLDTVAKVWQPWFNVPDYTAASVPRKRTAQVQYLTLRAATYHFKQAL